MQGIRQHTSAYVSIRQHTSAYVSRLWSLASSRASEARYSVYVRHTSAYVSIRQQTLVLSLITSKRSKVLCICKGIRQHTSAYVSMRQHTSAYVSIRQHASAYVSMRQHTSAYVSIRQHTSAHVSIRQHTSAHVSNTSADAGLEIDHKLTKQGTLYISVCIKKKLSLSPPSATRYHLAPPHLPFQIKK
jgi:hypothetical protein